MKTALIVIIICHGLIHLLGFIKNYNLAELNGYTGETIFRISEQQARGLGIAWLCATTLFLSVAGLIMADDHSWWLMGWIAIVLSQILIIIYWKDAKAGTIVNIIVLILSIPAFADWQFDRKVSEEINSVLSFPTPIPTLLTTEMTKRLPYPVQKWLFFSGADGKNMTYQVYLKQKGKMRTKPGGDWLSTDAEEIFTVDQPAFIWKAKVGENEPVWFSGRDKFEHGKGNMLIEAYSILPVVNGKGKKIDQGSLLRYLGEMCWFPSAAVSPYLTWEPIDSFSAKVTMNYEGTSASGIYQFDEQGRIKDFTAKRYMGEGESATLENWHAINTKWKTIYGITIPVAGEVTWELPSGRFSYYQWEIVSIQYNR